jgi:deoxycytidine triphosphate deaminase
LGILLSDRIRFYVDRVNLIHPFDEANLRPASYTLHVGSKYLDPGRSLEGDLEERGEVVIPPNGLIYIRFLEEVNIPYYLIARFNLRVKQVYRGLLLGTGPQVDPGFRGHLGCPIHNFTDESKVLKFREDIATIDFEKTTLLGSESLRGLNDAAWRALPLEDLRLGRTAVIGKAGARCLIYKAEKDRPIKEYLPPGESVKSSVLALQNRMSSLERRMMFFRRLAVLGAFGLIIAVLGMMFEAYRDLKSDVTKLTEAIAARSAPPPTLPAVPMPPQRPAQAPRVPSAPGSRN